MHPKKNWALRLYLILVCIHPGMLRAADIAFFYALDSDLQSLKGQAQPVGQPVSVCGRSVQRLALGSHRIYAVKMGSGPVETAVSAAALLGRFHCDLAFSIGPAGALDNQLRIGEWREVGATFSYQKGAWTKDGFQAGGEARGTTKESDAPVPPPVIAATPLSIASSADRLSVASGEIFVASSTYREQLRAQTGAQAVDMNLFGLTTACAAAQVPLRSWRIISDRADDGAGDAFRKFVTEYDGAGGRDVAAIIRQLPPDPNSPETYPELKRLLEKTSDNPHS